MFNYRALNWEAIEAIHQEMKAIISREEKLAKKRFITLSFQGLKKVAKFFSRLIQYAATRPVARLETRFFRVILSCSACVMWSCPVLVACS
jgi:hypothetical protein